MSKRDYYDVLGLAKNASDDEIKKAYRKMAMKFHPDRVTDEAEKANVEVKFKEAKEAYETLSDPEKRAVYDQYGHAGPQPFAHGNPRGGAFHRTWSFDDGGREDIHHIFEEMMKNHGMFNNRQQTPQVQINISLKDAYIGRTVQHEKNTVVIPKGVRSGTKLFVNGTIYRIDILLNEKFKRSLDDLMADVTITAIEAMLGVEVILEHLDGNKLQFSIPAGIQTGQIVKLSKTGMKNPETEHVGDMLVRVSITTPRNLSDTDRQVLKNLSHRDSIVI